LSTGAQLPRLAAPVGLDLDASLARFSRYGDDQMDRWDGHRFMRPYRIEGEIGAVRLRRQPATDFFLEVETAPVNPTPGLGRRLQSMFVDEQDALAELGRRDPVIAELKELHPGVFPVRALDPLGALLAMVTAQQVNLTLALTVRRAILQRLGQRIVVGDEFVICPDPEQMAAASPEGWAELRLTKAKARCLGALGAAICRGELSLEALELASDAEVRERLTELPGLGPWTASQYLTRVLGRPVVVADDLGVRKAVQLAYRLPLMPLATEVLELTADYREAAFSAQQLLLFHLMSKRGTRSVVRR
jgi:3-methyladenine DNA glycosylase/8-oxoguanine DNA glycosylase